MAATFNNAGSLHAGRDINQVAGNMGASDSGDGAETSTPARVFISYRRDDAAGEAGRLYDSLTERLGRHAVFVAAEEIQPGEEFGAVTRERIVASDVMLVLIGRRWANATDATGRFRLNSPDDWVRREIETALHARVPLIPVLVDGAPIPVRERLPGSIRRLADLHAFTIGEHWHGDVDRLDAAIRRQAGRGTGG